MAILTYVVQMDRYIDTRAVSPTNAWQLTTDARQVPGAIM